MPCRLLQSDCRLREEERVAAAHCAARAAAAFHLGIEVVLLRAVVEARARVLLHLPVSVFRGGVARCERADAERQVLNDAGGRREGLLLAVVSHGVGYLHRAGGGTDEAELEALVTHEHLHGLHGNGGDALGEAAEQRLGKHLHGFLGIAETPLGELDSIAAALLDCHLLRREGVQRRSHARPHGLVAELDFRAVRLVDVVLDACYAHQRALFLELLAGEADEPSEAYLAADVRPVLLRPDAVKLASEGELVLLVVEQVLDGGAEHVPRRAALVCVVAYVGGGEHAAEHGVLVARFRQKFIPRHHYSVQLLRHDLEASCGLSARGLMEILHVKLAPREHPRLEDDRHALPLDEALAEVEFVGD